MDELMGITVEHALELSTIKRLKLLAGKNGIRRKITRVNIMEVPDILDWVHDGELLVTTLYAIKDDQEALKNLIPNLVEKNLAGIAIKPGRYIEYIPYFMLEQADRFNFPLLKVPYDLSYSELINPILKEILNKRTQYLEKVLNIHEILTNSVLEGLDNLNNELVRLINNPIVMVDTSNLVLSKKIPEGNPATIQLEDLLSTIETKNIVFDEEDNNLSCEEKVVELEGKKVRQIVMPIKALNNVLGYLYTWEVLSGINKIDLSTLKWACTIAALNILNKSSISQVERRYKNEFLYDVLKGNIKEKDTLQQRAQMMGWSFDAGYHVILFDLKELINKHLKASQTMNQNLQKKLVDVINHSKNPRVVCGDLGTFVVVLYPLQDGKEDNVREDIRKFVRRVISIFPEVDRSLIKIGVGEYVRDIMDVNQSYIQAKRTLNIINKIKPEDLNLYFYDELGIYKLFYDLKNTDVDLFLQETIYKLLRYDRQHNTDLIRTLEAYFEENGNLSNIAKKLYIHYNTALYRLQRIEKITGFSLSNAHDRLNLEVALRILQMSKKYGE